MNSAKWHYNNYYDEWTCEDCDRDFRDWNALRRHLSTSSQHNWCQPCDRDFISPNALQSHRVNSANHGWCVLCDTEHDNKVDLRAHYERDHFPCEGCRLTFKSEIGRHEHGRQAHPYCMTHRRAFLSTANYNAHMNSSAHKSADIACPAGCGRSFISYTAVALHLESGTCSSGFTKERVDYFIRQWDRKGWISTGRLALTAPPSNSCSSSRPQTHLATEASYSYPDQAYKCFFCIRLFSTLRALNQHLGSPRHAYSTVDSPMGEKLYHCANRRGGCTKEFLSLSGLMGHVEGGSCGVREMRGVMNALDQVLGGMNRLTL